jgi:rod shape-determining protein MreC
MATLHSDSRPIIGRGPSLLARTFFLGALSIGIMALDQRQDYLTVARSFLSTAVHPLRALVDLPFRSIDGLGDYFADRDRLQRENADMQAKLRVANLQLQRFAALAEENRQLRAVREASAGINAKTAIAEIMRVDLDPGRHRVLLNKGASDGLYKGQAVLDADGVFGQVTRVGRYASEAILITDAETATPIRVNRTGLRSIAVGTGDFNKLTLPFITGDADIKPGDLLVTSGLGGIFPAGYPVAQVTQVKRDPAATFALVEAKPLAHMDHARELLLVWFEPPPTLDIDAPPAEKKPAGKPQS